MKVILATGASVPLCDTPGLFGAIGLADGSIVFVPGAARGLWQVPSQGGERTLMLVPDFTKGDGKILVFEDLGPTTGSDIKLLSFLGEGKTSVREFAVTSFNERQASFSPDGRWIAYISDESGEFEVYVQPSDGVPQRRKVSTNGGTEPVWNPKGGELIFFKGQTAYAVTVKSVPGLVTSAPREVFKTSAMITNSRFRNVDISRDGSRIVMMVPLDDPKELEIHVILNWFEELKRLVPTGK